MSRHVANTFFERVVSGRLREKVMNTMDTMFALRTLI